jgi:hypothetical protein
VLRPEVIEIPPAALLFPLPIARVNEPPLPPDAAPVPIVKNPEVPELEVPEEKVIAPLTPEVPALTVET